MAPCRSKSIKENDGRRSPHRPDRAYCGPAGGAVGTRPLADMPRPEDIAALLNALATSLPNSDAAELLPAMMRTLGLNPSAVRKFCTDPYVALELVCRGCENVEACRRWLAAADRNDPAYRDFCPNAERLAVLRAVL